MRPSPDPVFRALADPTRRGLYERLCREQTATVTALTRSAGVSQPVVSRHLKHLREAGLVAADVRGRETHYSAVQGGLGPLQDWTREMSAFWEARLDGLSDLLKRMDQ